MTSIIPYSCVNNDATLTDSIITEKTYPLYQWRPPSFHWTWLSAGSFLWSELAVWCKTGFPRRWVGHTCCPSPSHHDNCKSWSWDRTAEGAGGYRRTEHDAGAGSCPRTYPSGGRWPPCRRRSEGPPPWWQLLMRTPQPLTAPDHSWNHSSLVHSSNGLKHDTQWSKAGPQRGVEITHPTPLFLSSPSIIIPLSGMWLDKKHEQGEGRWENRIFS